MTGFGVAALCGVLFLCFIQNSDAGYLQPRMYPKRPPNKHKTSLTDRQRRGLGVPTIEESSLVAESSRQRRGLGVPTIEESSLVAESSRQRREIPKLREKTASVSHQLKESEDAIVVQKRAVPASSFSGNFKDTELIQTREKKKRSVAYEPTLKKHMVEVQPNYMQKRSVAFEPKVESNVEAVQPNYMQKRAAAPVKLANEEVSSVVKSKRAIQQEAVEKEHFLNKEELWKKNAIEKRDIAAMSQLIENEKQFEGIVFPELDGGLGKEAAVIQKRESGGFGGAAEI